MSRAIILALFLLGASTTAPRVARAEEPRLRAATLYLTASSSSAASLEPALAPPYELARASHHHRRGAYLLTVGVSLLVGALAHAAVLASVKHCGIERPNIILDAAIASIGIGISFAGWRQLQLAPLGQHQLTPLTKGLGLPATAFGTLAITAAATGIASFATCFEVN